MYSLRLAIQSIIKEKYINAISMISLGISLFLLFSVFLVIYNIEHFTGRLPEKFSLMVYIKDTVKKDGIKRIEETLKKEPLVSAVTFISKEQALKDLKDSLKDADSILKGLDENPLLASFKIGLNRKEFSIDGVNNLLRRVREMKEIDEVMYGEQLLGSIHSLKSGVKILGLITSSVVLIAILFICYSTVKILFYRHREEIEIYKLLGATKNFIRTPFLLEGSIIGLLGGILSIVVLSFINSLLIERLSETFPLLASLTIPLTVKIIPPIIGGFLGISGAAIALGKLRY